MIDRREALELFYSLMADLEVRCGGFRLLAQCDGRMAWPQRGVYFFFEDGETRNMELSRRVVRVGTHGLRPSRSTLWGRLSQHKGTVNGLYAGGGAHRGSVFRLHVGSALLNDSDGNQPAQESWAKGLTAGPATRRSEHAVEQKVSDRIGAMPFLWVPVNDAASAFSDRGVIERGALALLSNHTRPVIDPCSPDWLGLQASSEKIRLSGLWNVNHVTAAFDPQFLSVLATHISGM